MRAEDPMANRFLYLVRHGEYEAAPDAGPEDGTLSPAGVLQSELLAARLRDVPFTAIHHSPWQRAEQTAKILAEHHPHATMGSHELLTECVPTAPDREHLTEQQAAWFAGLPQQLIDEGAAQATAAFGRFGGPSRTGRTEHELLVAHGNLINWFVCRALDAPAWSWLRMLDYHCALTVILYLPDRVKLVCYNDVGHLPPALRGTDYPPDARI
jgi:probable phosphoglycerate mutase